jgi:hypothetical protein
VTVTVTVAGSDIPHSDYPSFIDEGPLLRRTRTADSVYAVSVRTRSWAEASALARVTAPCRPISAASRGMMVRHASFHLQRRWLRGQSRRAEHRPVRRGDQFCGKRRV